MRGAYPSVVLDRQQRAACCELVLDELLRVTCDHAGRIRRLVAGGQLLQAMEWDDPHADGSAFELEISCEIRWLFEDVFAPFAVEYLRPRLEQRALFEAWSAGVALPSLPTSENDLRMARDQDNCAYERAIAFAVDAVLDAVA